MSPEVSTQRTQGTRQHEARDLFVLTLSSCSSCVKTGTKDWIEGERSRTSVLTAGLVTL